MVPVLPPLVVDFLGSLVRFALVFVLSRLKEHGVLTSDQVSTYIGPATANVLAWLVCALPLLWSFRAKFVARVREYALHATAAFADAGALARARAEVSLGALLSGSSAGSARAAAARLDAIEQDLATTRARLASVEARISGPA